MEEFGYIDRLNGLNYLPHWRQPPCKDNRIRRLIFPPRDITNSDVLYVYDKICAGLYPLQYEKGVTKDENHCFDTRDYDAIKGLQNISPCQYGAPVYLSNPHFIKLMAACWHRWKKLGVPLEGKVRIQLNLKVTQARDIYPWEELCRYLRIPACLSNYVFTRDPTLEILEMGRRSLRRGSSFIAHHQHKLMHRESYTLLKTNSTPYANDQEDAAPMFTPSNDSS
ncbi:hypothetical protein EVAR_101498_1 [Eumeta japonica]|uniref:Uncharacterized protein n=1 Tax=Eumeta variegata TaxID=151549 RepID=A0A4C1T6U4_EUMVA|nr:hypothetical protein EVAR_101498_1 [Eumeta japonica]